MQRADRHKGGGEHGCACACSAQQPAVQDLLYLIFYAPRPCTVCIYTCLNHNLMQSTARFQAWAGDYKAGSSTVISNTIMLVLTCCRNQPYPIGGPDQQSPGAGGPQPAAGLAEAAVRQAADGDDGDVQDTAGSSARGAHQGEGAAEGAAGEVGWRCCCCCCWHCCCTAGAPRCWRVAACVADVREMRALAYASSRLICGARKPCTPAIHCQPGPAALAAQPSRMYVLS
jgi:hypothetical protein